MIPFGLTSKSRWFLERSPPAFWVDGREIEAKTQENWWRGRNHLPRLVRFCVFSLATSEGYINKEGEKVIDTQWHRIVAWGKTAQLVEKICRKGNRIAIDGKLTNRSYEDEKGEKKYITEIIANELMIINPQAAKPSTWADIQIIDSWKYVARETFS